jgi:hypothetical protein
MSLSAFLLIPQILGLRYGFYDRELATSYVCLSLSR